MQAQYRLMYLARSRTIGFRQRVEQAKRIIGEFLERCSRPYISFSVGKDSEAILILLHQMGICDIPICTQGDDLDFPDKREYGERIVAHLGHTDYTYAYADISALAQLADEDVSGTFTHVMNRFAVSRRRNGFLMGLRSEESWHRRRLIKAFGHIYERKTKYDPVITETVGLPLHNWRGEDVMALIVSTDTPYMHVYDRDNDRMPHEIRFSWMVSPQFFDRDCVAWLRRHYPEQFAKLAQVSPGLLRYT